MSLIHELLEEMALYDSEFEYILKDQYIHIIKKDDAGEGEEEFYKYNIFIEEMMNYLNIKKHKI